MSVDVYMHVSPSGKAYVGIASKGMQRRWRSHVTAALRGSGLLFHRAIRKYGADSFTHQVLETYETWSEAVAAECRWIVELNTRAPAGYNATSGGDGVANPSPTTRARMRAAAAARMTDAARKHLRAVNIGRAVSEETRAKMRSRTQGHDTRTKQRAAWTPERRAAQAERMKGRPKSAETRAKLSAAVKQARTRGEAL